MGQESRLLEGSTMNELQPRRENGLDRPKVPMFSELYDGGEIVYEESAGLISSYPMARFVLIGLLVVAMLASIFPAREHFSDPSAYQTTIQTLDEKKTNVTVMIAVAMGASTGITLIPDDTGTPIADKLADIAGDLAIVLGALYLEKYLLTIFGTTTFLLLIPAACLATIAWLLLFDRWPIARAFSKIARRLALLGLVLVIAVPVSTMVTRQIDETYGDSAAIMADVSGEEVAEMEEEEPEGFLDKIASLAQDAFEGLTSVPETVMNQVNRLVEGFAVMIVTSCVIPILVLAFFLWLSNMFLGINIEAPMQRLRHPRVARRRPAKAPAGSELSEKGPTQD